MSVELNWHEGDEHPNIMWDTAAQDLPVPNAAPSTIAKTQRAERKKRLPRPRTLILIVALPVLALLIGVGAVLWRANQGSELARRDIEAVAQAVAQAQRNGDYQLLATLVENYEVPQVDDRQAQLGALRSQSVAQQPEAIQIERVELVGARALAEVVETQPDGAALRKLTVFRRIDNQWRLARFDPELMGDELQRSSTHFHWTYRQEDEPFVNDLINAAEGAYVTLCGELNCRGEQRPLTVAVTYEQGSLLRAGASEMEVLSPWIAGLDEANRPSPVVYQSLVHQIAETMAQAQAPEGALSLWRAVGDWAASDLAGAALPGEMLFQEHIQAGRLPLPLDVMWREIAVDNADNPLAAAQMRRVLAFVQDVYGSDAVGRLLEGVPDHLHEIVRRSFNTDLQSVEQAWLTWLNAFPMLTQQS